MSWFSTKKEVAVPVEEDFSVDLDIPFDEEDLNDQSLLDELRELQVCSDQKPAAAKPKKVAKAFDEEVHVDDIIEKVKLEADHEPVVEFNEDDMNDPDLLKELQQVAPERASLSDGKDLTSSSEIQHRDVTPSPVVIVDVQSLPIVTSVPPEVVLDSKLKSTDIPQLLKFIHVEKMKALNKKRAGDKAGALESLKVAKEMEKRVVELQSISATLLDPHIANPEIIDNSEREVDIPEAQTASTSEYDLTLFNTRMIEFKKAALSYKRENDLVKAKDMVTIAKSIQKAIDTISDGLALVDFELPSSPVIQSQVAQNPLAQSSSTPLVSNAESFVTPNVNDQAPPASKSTTQKTPVPANELISYLITTLESQISTCTKLSAQYFTSNQKDLALEYHKKKKTFLQDKQTLGVMKSIVVDPNSLPFRFLYSERTYQMNQSFLDVALDQVEISIEKATDVFVKGVQELESLVCFDFGWPSNASGTLNEGKGETVTVKGLHPEYKYKNLVKIERTKPFQRFLERKKATFELFYLQKSMFGLMASRVCCGKAVVKLDDLLSKCEIHQVLPLMDPSNPRKPTGSTLEIKIRLRAPLIKPDVVNVSEQWLQVIFGESSAVQPLAVSVLPSRTHTPNSTKTDSSPSSTRLALIPRNRNNNSPSKSPSASSPTVQPVSNQVSPSDKNTGTTNPDIDELEHSFLMQVDHLTPRPENIVSNAVLEHEHKLVIQQIAKGNKSEELQDLKSSYEIKMNMLVTSIQLGSLDMPAYMTLVKDSIKKTKDIAIAFKKANRIELAKKALVRVKIMTSEVDEVESQ